MSRQLVEEETYMANQHIKFSLNSLIIIEMSFKTYYFRLTKPLEIDKTKYW